MRTWTLIALVCVAAAVAVLWGGDLMNWHRSFPAALVNEIATWSSIYSLIVSLAGVSASAYAAWGVAQIRTRYLAKARLPTIGKKLLKDASMLSDLAEEVPVPQQEKTRVFSSLKANLEAVRRHLPSHLKRTHQKTAKLFDRLSHEAEAQPAGASLSTLGSFWLTYEQVQLLKYEIDHYLADEKWDS